MVSCYSGDDLETVRWANASSGKLESLMHGKKPAAEIKKGSECGMSFDEWQDIEVGDQIQAYEVVLEPRRL
jgi:translation initiation factor IF-2